MSKWDGIDKKMAALDPDIHIEVSWVVYPDPTPGGHQAVFAYDGSSDAYSRKLHNWPVDKFASADEAVSQVKAFIDFLRNLKKINASKQVSAPTQEDTAERSRVWC